MATITFFENNKLTEVSARKLIVKPLEEVLSDIDDNPIPYENSGEAEYSLFTIYNGLLYKGQTYDIYGKFSYRKDCYEDCRIFLTLFVEKQGVTLYKDSIEESNISALVDYLLEIEELVYITEKECHKQKMAA